MPSHTFLHPTDLRPHSDLALAHSVRFALAHGGELELVHVAGPPADGERDHFPNIRWLLDRWDVLSSKATSAQIGALGFEWTNVHLPEGDPVDALAADIQRHPVDLVIMYTEARTGLDRMIKASVALQVARSAAAPVLLLPDGTDGFVDFDTGEPTLKRLLVPVENAYLGDLAIEAAVRLLRPLRPEGVEVTLLHIGEEHDFPALAPPDLPGWTFDGRTVPGRVAETINAVAGATYADAIVMAGRGHDSIGDRVFGSTVDQVIRGAECAVLSVPGQI